MAAFKKCIGVYVYILVCISIRQALTCSEKDVQMMTAVLEQVEDWERLTSLLDITRSAIDNINKNCPSFERAQCQWRELVKTYCDKISSGNPYEVATDIAHILHQMKKTKEAQEMKQLDFCTPTSNVDIQKITAVLEEVDDWEGLADWLDINSAYIREDCAPAPKPQCFRKKLVNIYRDRLGADDKCMIVSNIADALEKLKRKTTAQKLQQLYRQTDMEKQAQTTASEFWPGYYDQVRLIQLLLVAVAAVAANCCAAKWCKNKGFFITMFVTAVLVGGGTWQYYNEINSSAPDNNTQPNSSSVIHRLSVPVASTETPIPSELLKYADYLRTKYTKSPVTKPVGQSPSTTTTTRKYINLSLVKKEKVTQEQTNYITRLTLQGDVDQILQDSEQIEMDDILKIDNNTHLVVVEGAPGIGKSTLTRELCRQWAMANWESLKQFSLVVLLRLREEEVQSAKNINDLFPCGDDPDLSNKVAGIVKRQNGKGVLFVLDGFDQFPARYRHSSKSLLIQIITGEMLLKATVLITSRPSAMADLQSLFQIDFKRHIEILGFSEEGIEQYVESIFEPNLDILPSFNMYLSANPVVKGMMYNPLNAGIIVEVYMNNSNSGKPIPHTQTQLYTELTLCLISKYMSGKGDALARKLPDKLEDVPSDLYQQLVKVGELAFNGKLKNEVIFKQLPEGCTDLGLLVEHTALYTRKETTSYNFFHLTHQEFMSAFYISQLPTSKQRTLFIKHSNLTLMNVVWRFVAGLTNIQNIGWDEVKKSEVEKQIVVGDEELIRPFIIRYVYEAQDSQSCDNVFGEHKLNFISESISYFDLYALGYCISLCANKWNISVRTSEVGFGMLVHGMKSVDNVRGSIEELNLAQSRGIHRGHIPHQLLQHIKKLNLKGCVMDQRGFENLTDEWIPHMPNLTSLDISYNPGGDGSLVKLLRALKEQGNLQRLYMRCIAIGNDDVEALADLVHPSSSLKELEVDGSNCGQTLLGPDIEQQLVKTVLSSSLLEKLTIYADVRYATPTYIPILGFIETISASITSLSLTISSPLPTTTDENVPSSSFYERLSSFWTYKQTRRNISRFKGGAKLSNILRENSSLKELMLHIPLDKDEIQNITHSLKDNHCLEKLWLSEIFHSKYFSFSERQLLDSRIIWAT